jgi:hypothetical protein
MRPEKASFADLAFTYDFGHRNLDTDRTTTVSSLHTVLYPCRRNRCCALSHVDARTVYHLPGCVAGCLRGVLVAVYE